MYYFFSICFCFCFSPSLLLLLVLAVLLAVVLAVASLYLGFLLLPFDLNKQHTHSNKSYHNKKSWHTSESVLCTSCHKNKSKIHGYLTAPLVLEECQRCSFAVTPARSCARAHVSGVFVCLCVCLRVCVRVRVWLWVLLCLLTTLLPVVNIIQWISISQ